MEMLADPTGSSPVLSAQTTCMKKSFLYPAAKFMTKKKKRKLSSSVTSPLLYYSRILKLWAKHLKHLCELPAYTGQHTNSTAGIHTDQSRESELLNMKWLLDPTCRKYIEKTEKILSNKSFNQPLRSHILQTPSLCHQEEISHIWHQQTRSTFQLVALGKPRHSGILSQCSKDHSVL